MEKISKLFGMLVLGMAGIGFAANSFEVECGLKEVPDVGDEATGTISRLICNITQGTDGSLSWEEVVSEVSYAHTMYEPGSFTVYEVNLGSDITFDEPSVGRDGSPSCSYVPPIRLVYEVDGYDVSIVFNGNNKTISNYCSIGDLEMTSVGLIDTISNGTIKDITFDNAYVMSRLPDDEQATTASAAVIAVKSENVAFENVTVKNSKVYGMDVGSVVSFANGGSFKNVTVTSTDVATPDAVFPEYSNVIGNVLAISSSSKLGGVAAVTSEVSSFININLSAVSVGVNNAASVSYNFESMDGPEIRSEAFRNRVEGGVVGKATTSVRNFEYEGGSVEVTLGRGSGMGGLFGSSSLSGYAHVRNVTSKVIVSPTCEEDNYIGGFVGESADKNLTFQNNKGSLTLDWGTVSSCGETFLQKMFVGGLVGGGTSFGSMSSMEDTVAINFNIGTAYNRGAHAIGGLWGYVENNLALNAKNDYVTANISDFAAVTDSTQIGGLIGGEVGADGREGSSLELYRNEVLGSIKVSATRNVAVGGLVGNAMHGNLKMEIFHNVMKNDIVVPDGVLAGFVVGHVRVREENLSIAGNFHIGVKDSNVSSVVGRYDDESDNEVVDWNMVFENELGYEFPSICFNYRNAVSGLEEMDADWLLTSGAFLQEGGYLYNGILSDSAMKTIAFAHALNAGVYSKRGGGSNDAIVLNKSWWSDGKDYPRFVDDNRLRPYAPNMLTVDYSRVADQMTVTQKVAMAPYMAPDAGDQFVAFSSNEGKLSPDFIAAFNALDWDYVMDGVLSKDSILENDRQYTMYEDREFVVSYWIDDETSRYELKDGGDKQILFYTPKVNKVKLSDVNKLIPHIQVKSGTTEHYRLNGFAFNCLDASICGDEPLEFSPNYSVTSSFKNELSWLIYQSIRGYSDILQVIYKSVSEGPYVKALPYVYFANALSSIDVYAMPYAYTSSGEKGILTDDRYSAGPTDLSYSDMTSEFGIRTGKGFALTDWTVDLWVGFEENYTARNINGCYGENALDFCTSDKVIAAKANRYIGTVDGLVDSIRRNSSDNLWKWTISLKGDETIVMDSLILAFSKIANNGFSTPVVYMHVSPKVEFIDYTITFVPNGMNVFFGDSWKREGVHSLASEETASLPSIYSTEGFFKGWSTDYDSDVARYFTRELSEEVLDNATIDEDNGFKMYSHWENEYPELRQIYLEIANEGVEIPNGTLSLVQSYYDKERGEDVPRPHSFDDFVQNGDGLLSSPLAIPAADESMTFRVDVEPNPGYKLESLTYRSNKPTEEGYGLIIGTDTTFRVEAYNPKEPTEHYLVAQFDPIPYFFTFSRETGSDWFYPTDWRDTAIYSIEISDDQPNVPMMYSINGESVGWHTAKTIADGCDCSPVDSKYVISEYMYREDYYTEKDSLYMILDKENASNETMKINEAALGDVRLVQSIGSKDDGFVVDTISHSFVDGEMLIPSVDADFEFTVRLAVDKGYAIESAEYTFDTTIVNNRVSRTYPLENGAKIVLNPRKMRNIQFSVVTTPVRYMIAFDNPDTAGVIYEKEFFEHGDYTIEREDLSYPSGMYTSDRCLLGWKSEGSNEVMTSFDVEKMEGLKDGENTLTAVWGDAAACDNEVSEKDTLEGPYNRLVLDAKGGSVEIVQMVKNEAGQDSVVRTRKFGDDNSMLFPQDISENTWYVVNVVANDGYEVPEVLYFYNDTGRGAEKGDTVEIKNGDALYNDRLFASVLKAVFNKIDDTPDDTTEIVFVDPTLLVSGNAMQVRFATNEFNVDRKAKIRLDLLDVMGNEIDSMIVDVDEAPYSSSWTKTSLAPGSYVLTGTIWDAYKESTFDTSFVVANKIVAATMDGWQMLALDVIDKKSVDWTDSDAVFFWWDEHSSVGEYWQYRTYGEEDKVSLVTGGWYSSLEGRALEIREDVEVPESAEWVLENEFSGWNLVANPYNWTIANPVDSGWCWLPDIADYDIAPKFLEPYQAIWVRTDKNTTISLDKTPVFETNVQKDNAEGAGEKRRALAKANSKFDWAIRAILQDEKGRTDGWNVLGVGDMAQVEEPPESMADHVNLSIVEGRKHLAKSMKQVSEDGYTWNLEVSATSNRRGFLGFEGMNRLAALGYRLFVTVDERTVEMTDGQELPVALKSLSKSVKVQVVKSEAQLATSVSGLKMVQQGSMVNVSFNVPAELSGSRFVAEVAGLDGKKMSSSSGKAISGRNEVHMNIPKSGLYFVRVRVASQQASGKFLAK
ncbi:hypothetical protein BGX12_11647 [Fibrobacter sp. UWR4]|uniref:hypothetical protein n=1 Tax=Fibrobacter sp. UWR4 TaxID=1896218 RepID=UPI000D6B32A3|nr:hypothetical protein [Fibrobacter sp. UWR4]PWJ64073.1 hypothetical protein BGX12_11647 [Fibrobacter sp. UWR4]